MSYSIGGAPVRRLTFTKSWGLTPGSALITCPGTVNLPPGSSASFSIGGSSFIGVVNACNPKESRSEGRTTEISVSDNRVRLGWDTVYCVFNMVEIIEDDPTKPFIQRAKRFWHILPRDWHAQTKTFTPQPYTGRQICDALFAADTVQFAWNGSYNDKFNQPVFGLDCNTGKKLGNVLQEIADKLGVLFSVSGSNTLIFATKGEGTAPSPGAFNSDDRIQGSALGPETKVRIVGDRNVYQDFPIDLEPDWIRGYEKFWFQPAWIAEVQKKFGLTDYGEATARSKVITVREYSALAGSEYLDRGTWGDISRPELPVWAYITDILYKSYRVPRAFTINGVPLSSLALREGLLYGVKLTSPTDGKMDYDKGDGIVGTPYPDAKGFCIVKGQPLSLLNPETYDSISPEIFAKAAQNWQEINRFSLDQKNYAILFDEPIFFSDNLYIRANPTATEESLKKIVVPNADATIAPAEVRVSLCFEAERYSRWSGSGNRHGVQYVQGLNYHTLFKDHSWKAEVYYANDEESRADALAAKAASAYLTGQNIIESGGFTRYGAAGTSLNGAIDRVTVSLTFDSGGEGEGISEQVEYAKERNPTAFESERELERRSQARDLFPGQSRLREEAKEDRALSRLQKSTKNPIEHPIKTLDQISTVLMGNPQGSVSYALLDSAFTYPVGMPVFVDEQNIVSSTGKRFAGCLTTANVAGSANSPIPTAAQGTVPCRVKGPIEIGDAVGVNDLKDYAQSQGMKFIGEAQQKIADTSTKVILVKMGGSASSDGHPYRVSGGSDATGPYVNITLGHALDFTDWFDPKVYPATIGGTSLIPEDGVRPKLYLPDTNFCTVYAKIPQASDGSIDSTAEVKVNLEAHPTTPTIESQFAYVPIAEITTSLVDGSRRIDQINQITASHIMWPLKSDFIGWVNENTSGEENTPNALWLGADSSHRPDSSSLNDLWLNVERDEFDDGREGNQVFGLQMEEGQSSYSLGFNRSAVRGFEFLMSDPVSVFTIDAKSEDAPAGIKLSSGDDTAFLSIRGDSEENSLLAEVKSTGSKISGGGDSGSFALDASTALSLKLTADSGVAEYLFDKILMAAKTFEPHTLTSGGDTFDILSNDDITIDDLPCCMDWDDDTDTLLIGDGTECAISVFKLLVDAGGKKISLNNTVQPNFLMEYNGGNFEIDVNEFATLTLNDGIVTIGPEIGFLITNEDDETEGCLLPGSLTLGDQAGDGVDINSADIPTGKGIVSLREININDGGDVKKAITPISETYLAS